MSSLQEAIENAQDIASDDDTIFIHRKVIGCDSEHVNDATCWCGPVAISASQPIDLARLQRFVVSDAVTARNQ